MDKVPPRSPAKDSCYHGCQHQRTGSTFQREATCHKQVAALGRSKLC